MMQEALLSPRRPRWRLLVLIALFSLISIVISVLEVGRHSDGLRIERTTIGEIPATIFKPATNGRTPVVVVTHGFAGSQQMMQPMAATLARNGYVAITFDFAGHGRNRTPLSGGIVDLAASTRVLLDEIDEVVRFARTLPDYDGRLALVGHSMASELVVQYAMENPGVDAVAALSLFGRAVTPQSPRNLIVIDGAWEPSVLKDAASRIVTEAAGKPARERMTYGDFTTGAARRYAYAAGAEHIGVIYSFDALSETLDWMNAAFAGQSHDFIDRRGKWLALLLIGSIALARVACEVLPRLKRFPANGGRSFKQLAAICLAATIATPLVLRKAPTDFLPILLGDYLAAHFAVYGGVLWLGLWLTRSKPWRVSCGVGSLCAIAAAGLVAAYIIIAIGWPLDAFVTSFAPGGIRWALIPIEFGAIALAFTAEERLARGSGVPRFAYTICKIAFVASLALAILLNPTRLFFLAIIVPVVTMLFVLFGLVNRWAFGRTRHAMVGALGTAFALAWAISVTFPLVD
jgi:dienelactone hydrolase